jgi:hypothetical protein
VFGFVKDSFPDRWGRLLLNRRERIAAKEKGRPVRQLSNYDYLVGIEDLPRMGGIRYSKEENGRFILTPKGWTLSPAYDINPSTQTYQCLLINEDTENSDINVLQDSCESYMLDATEASDIISQVKDTIRDWQRIATKNQIPVRILQPYVER